MDTIFTKNLTGENPIYEWRNLIPGCHPWMENVILHVIPVQSQQQQEWNVVKFTSKSQFLDFLGLIRIFPNLSTLAMLKLALLSLSISQPQHCLALALLSLSIAQHSIALPQHCLALALLSIRIALHKHCLALALLCISIAQPQYCLSLALALLTLSIVQPQHYLGLKVSKNPYKPNSLTLALKKCSRAMG